MGYPASQPYNSQAQDGIRGWIIILRELMIVAILLTWELSKLGKERFMRFSPRVRGLMLIIVAVLMLALTGILVAAAMYEAPVPTIREQIAVAPYSLEGRKLPPIVDGSFISMPDEFGDFERLSEVPADASTSSLINQCVLDTSVGQDNECNVQQMRTQIAFERYRSGQGWVDISIAKIGTPGDTLEMVAGLYRYARRTGQTGNFAIYGVGPIDFFYSREPGWITFVYSHDQWIISISSRTQAMLDAAVNQFPY
ncbi:MAG TPA: hypothetical protein PKD09_07445 [Aggregatilinea sp.]|jgi:hypothetical protein|uniref:hypothetical protein n=1 Tax=Aggregatilinea sp. TaxID=2806333 RepID=UPI002C2EE444|nr:hypothetical protein [Aggregatilinea sp.]HML21463.1 hypothetical protein [Aggregatilinea sp.]